MLHDGDRLSMVTSEKRCYRARLKYQPSSSVFSAWNVFVVTSSILETPSVRFGAKCHTLFMSGEDQDIAAY